MVCYLQPESVVKALKAAVGEDVVTPYGEGKVKRYRLEDDIYEILLSSKALLYARCETFDRVDDSLQDRGSAFGVSWLLRYLFFSSESTKGESGSHRSQRSRSSSITSIGQTGRS
jgi:hypothetical protein